MMEIPSTLANVVNLAACARTWSEVRAVNTKIVLWAHCESKAPARFALMTFFRVSAMLGPKTLPWFCCSLKATRLKKRGRKKIPRKRSPIKVSRTEKMATFDWVLGSNSQVKCCEYDPVNTISRAIAKFTPASPPIRKLSSLLALLVPSECRSTLFHLAKYITYWLKFAKAKAPTRVRRPNTWHGNMQKDMNAAHSKTIQRKIVNTLEY
mmetsp:Transcript_10514/g.18024  ORF Transcript_10514/g.18024 Transcript_10514/m.18024 type:complete len:209 (-) Transcript_10514:169-795(-)